LSKNIAAPQRFRRIVYFKFSDVKAMITWARPWTIKKLTSEAAYVVFLTTEPRAEVDNSNKADPSIPVV
jgi:hypothetical protein